MSRCLYATPLPLRAQKEINSGSAPGHSFSSSKHRQSQRGGPPSVAANTGSHTEVDQSQDIISAAANTGSHTEVDQSQDIISAAANTGSHTQVDQSQDIPSAAANTGSHKEVDQSQEHSFSSSKHR